MTASPAGQTRLPRWRIAAAAFVLGALAWFGARLTPVYLANQEFQHYVEEVTARAENASRSDDLLRTWVIDKAASLDLPVRAGDVRIRRGAEGLGIEVRYVVRVDLPVYTVDLHFHPGAGVR